MTGEGDISASSQGTTTGRGKQGPASDAKLRGDRADQDGEASPSGSLQTVWTDPVPQRIITQECKLTSKRGAASTLEGTRQLRLRCSSAAPALWGKGTLLRTSGQLGAGCRVRNCRRQRPEELGTLGVPTGAGRPGVGEKEGLPSGEGVQAGPALQVSRGEAETPV